MEEGTLTGTTIQYLQISLYSHVFTYISNYAGNF